MISLKEPFKLENLRRKYIMTDEIKMVDGHILHRIEPLFFDSRGVRGGWIECEDNLSHSGSCWVGEEACVYDGAKVEENALVLGESHVLRSEISGNSMILSGSKVEKSIVRDYAVVSGDTCVKNSEILEYAYVGCLGDGIFYSKISGRAQILGTVLVDQSAVTGFAYISGTGIRIENDSFMSGYSRILNTRDITLINSSLSGQVQVIQSGITLENCNIEGTSDIERSLKDINIC